MKVKNIKMINNTVITKNYSLLTVNYSLFTNCSLFTVHC